jgi:hypothetical protein
MRASPIPLRPPVQIEIRSTIFRVTFLAAGRKARCSGNSIQNY